MIKQIVKIGDYYLYRRLTMFGWEYIDKDYLQTGETEWWWNQGLDYFEEWAAHYSSLENLESDIEKFYQIKKAKTGKRKTTTIIRTHL